MSLTVTNIQRFCVHDGPGIRTTVFLKGCSLRCPWCANPETINPSIEYYVDEKKCKCNVGTKNCFDGCSVLKCQPPTGNDYSNCKAKAILRFGKTMSEDEVYSEIAKDEVYYENGGGVTFSGGEPLLQLGTHVEFLKRVHDSYNVCIESSLSTPKGLEECQPYIDTFLVDLKTMVKEDYKSVVHGNLDNYVNNLKILHEHDRMKDVTFRIPYVPDMTNKAENIAAINNLIEEYGIKGIQLFSLHNLAKPKYESIGKEFVSNAKASSEELDSFKKQLACKDITILKI